MSHPAFRHVARLTVLPALASLALSGCLSAPPPLNLPDASVIGYQNGRAVPPDCAKLNEPSHMVDAGTRMPSVAFGCATYSNLAVMIARPEDVVAPLPYAGADAATAASAVRRYQEDRIKQSTTPTATTTTTPAAPTTSQYTH
ncbi:CpaD family pilus assembly lipoprotein [Trinickia sp. YCB016]